MSAADWQQPPHDILGRPAPIRQFVARSATAVVALQQAIAYPQGCTLDLQIAVRRGSQHDDAWQHFHEGDLGDLRLGIRFPGGAKATPVENAFPGWSHPTDRPDPPMLVAIGGDSASDTRSYRGTRRFWLWPLPAPGPFDVIVEWPSQGIPVTATTLDATLIAEAAAHAEPYWP
jgi:hypothetical protein